MSSRLFFPSISGKWDLGLNSASANQVQNAWLDGILTIRGKGLRVNNVGEISNLTNINVSLAKDIDGAGTSYGMHQTGKIQSSSVNVAMYYSLGAQTLGTTSINHIYGFIAQQTGSYTAPVTGQSGFRVGANWTDASDNYGFYSAQPSGAAHWGVYIANAKAYFGHQVLQVVATSNPASGGSYTFTNNVRNWCSTGTGTKASLTVNMSAGPPDGTKHTVTVRGAITALTVGGNGNSIFGAPTTLAANGFFEMTYSAALAAWIRTG